MQVFELNQIDPKELAPGFKAQFIHSENMTFSYWKIDAGSSLPQHAHYHEQVVNMLEGEFELSVGEEHRVLKPGEVVVIPGNVSHGGRAITDCRMLDVFYPVREDYK